MSWHTSGILNIAQFSEKSQFNENIKFYHAPVILSILTLARLFVISIKNKGSLLAHFFEQVLFAVLLEQSSHQSLLPHRYKQNHLYYSLDKCLLLILILTLLVYFIQYVIHGALPLLNRLHRLKYLLGVSAGFGNWRQYLRQLLNQSLAHPISHHRQL